MKTNRRSRTTMLAALFAGSLGGCLSGGDGDSLATTAADNVAPVVGAFSLPAGASNLTVAITALSATDNTGVSGYLITENAVAPAPSASGWRSDAPASFTFASAGAKTLYAWAKDAAGNVSAAKTATTTITLASTDTTAPVIANFTLPVNASGLTVPISAITATDNVAVTGYLISESVSIVPEWSDRWQNTPPGSHTFSGEGAKTLYAWVKDAAGNVSQGKIATTTITLAASPITSANGDEVAATALAAATSTDASSILSVGNFIVGVELTPRQETNMPGIVLGEILRARALDASASMLPMGVQTAQTSSCSGGGQRKTTLNVASSTSGFGSSGDSVVTQYYDCKEGNSSTNGTLRITLSSATGKVGTAPYGFSAAVEFTDLKLAADTTNYSVFNGAATVGFNFTSAGVYAVTLASPRLTFDGKRNNQPVELALTNPRSQNANNGGTATRTYSGLYAASLSSGNRYQAMKFATVEPTVTNGQGVMVSGKVLVEGSSSALRMTFNNGGVKLEIDANGDGSFETTRNTTTTALEALYQ